MPYLTKKFKFCAAHQYGHSDWSSKKNREVFGKDARLHGHNYELEVTVTGEINEETGFHSLLQISSVNFTVRRGRRQLSGQGLP